MNSVLALPDVIPSSRRAPDADDTISRHVMALLAGAYPSGRVERRREQRFPYPHLVYLTPCTDDGCPIADKSVVVVGKHLSRSGLGFFHREPIAYRRMIASLESQKGTRISFLIDISWCRFNGHGWYDSGGRFLDVIADQG